MDSQKVPLISRNTFGQQTLAPRPPTPPLGRSKSARSVAELQTSNRPTLVRGHTPEPESSQSDVAKMYATNMFADPPAKRAYYRGPHVLTDGHERLLLLLREECGRLYSYTQRLKSDLTQSQNVAHHARNENANLRSRLTEARSSLAMANERLREQEAELVEKHDMLTEMDTLYQSARNKRASRNLTLEGVSFETAQTAAPAQAYYAS